MSMQPDDIVEFLFKRGTEATFAEFTKYMRGTRGPYELTLPKNPNAMVWLGMSKEFVLAIDKLRQSGRIVYTRTDPEVYKMFGKIPPFPIVPKNGVCLVKSWLPVLVELNINKEK